MKKICNNRVFVSLSMSTKRNTPHNEIETSSKVNKRQKINSKNYRTITNIQYNNDKNGIIVFIHLSKSSVTSSQIGLYHRELIKKKAAINFDEDFNKFPAQCIIGVAAINKAYYFDADILSDYPFVCYIITICILNYHHLYIELLFRL